MSNRLILVEKKPGNQGFKTSGGFLLLEMVVALGIMVLFCSIIVRYQQVSWRLQQECFERIRVLNRAINARERSAIRRAKQG